MHELRKLAGLIREISSRIPKNRNRGFVYGMFKNNDGCFVILEPEVFLHDMGGYDWATEVHHIDACAEDRLIQLFASAPSALNIHKTTDIFQDIKVYYFSEAPIELQNKVRDNFGITSGIIFDCCYNRVYCQENKKYFTSPVPVFVIKHRKPEELQMGVKKGGNE